jgi:hypothetical protein
LWGSGTTVAPYQFDGKVLVDITNTSDVRNYAWML